MYILHQAIYRCLRFGLLIGSLMIAGFRKVHSHYRELTLSDWKANMLVRALAIESNHQFGCF